MAEGEKQIEPVKNKVDVDGLEGNVCVRDLWKGENESDAEFMHLKETDPLETAGCWTKEEATNMYHRKLECLLTLYRGQWLRLKHVLKERRRAFLIQWQREGGSKLQAQAPSTGNSRMDIAYRCYGKRHGEEALLAWKRKKKRIAATVKLIESGKDPAYNAKHLQFISKLEQKEDLLPYPDCYVPDCRAESLPHSGYCYKHILYDPKQHLFTQCAHRFPSREKCINPVPKYVEPSYCLLHYHQSLIKERTSYSHLQREALIPSSQIVDKDKNESSSKQEESGLASIEPAKSSFQDDALLPADIAEGLMPLLEKELRSEDFQSILDMVGLDQPDIEQSLPSEKFQEDLFGKLDSNANNNRAGSTSQKSVDNQLQQLDNLPLPADIDTSMLSDLRTESSPLPDNILSINMSPHFKLQKSEGSSEPEELKQFEAKLQEQRLKNMNHNVPIKATAVTASGTLVINGQGGHSSMNNGQGGHSSMNNGLSSQHRVSSYPSLHPNNS